MKVRHPLAQHIHKLGTELLASPHIWNLRSENVNLFNAHFIAQGLMGHLGGVRKLTTIQEGKS